MQTSRFVLVILVASTTAACSATRSAQPRSARVTSPWTAMEIPRNEIDSLRERTSNAYDLIKRLRPAMLGSRAPVVSATSTALLPNASEVGVYVDGLYVGGIEILESITARSITSIRRITPATRSVQLGKRTSADAILITTDVASSRPRL